MISDSILAAILGKPSIGSLVISNSIDFADLEATYPAASYNGQYAIVDIGYRAKSMFVSDGEQWRPANGDATIAMLDVPVGIACSFTGSTNGAIVFGTALTNLIPKCFVYYPVNSVNASQPAGFYPTVFSSTTAAIVYDNVWVPGVGSEPTWPTSPTAFSGAVPGGTGITSELTVYTYGLPGGTLGEYGGIETAIQVEMNNVGGVSKITRIKLAASTAVGIITVTSSTIIHGLHRFKNIGSQSVQRGSTILPGTSTSYYYAAVNTSVDTTVSVTLQTSNPAEWAFLFYYVAKVVK